MHRRLEHSEKQTPAEDKHSLSKHFSPKVSTEATEQSQKKEQLHERRVREGKQTKFQGEIGEGLAIRVGSEELGLNLDTIFDFGEKKNGIDIAFRDSKNNLVLAEAKLSNSGFSAIKAKEQLQNNWTENRATRMQNPDDKRYYTPGNAKIGREIIDTGVENIRRLGFVTKTGTLEGYIYELQPDGSWKEIHSYNAFLYEQPILSNDVDDYL